jgi:hypothetical protein
MDWLGSVHVGTPTDTHATIEELCFLCVVRVEDISVGVIQMEGEEA